MLRILFILISIFCSSFLRADLENFGGDEVDIHELDQESIFVSLGSNCMPANLTRHLKLRKAAFPFDWNVLLEGEKLIQILEDDFSYFLNEDLLIRFSNVKLLNPHYHIEFVHDGSWDEGLRSSSMPMLQSKYKRRIGRFRNLKNHRGKVFFIRAAYIYSDIDESRIYKTKENVEISEEYALRLLEALKRYFPNLDFFLIIINNHEYKNFIEEKRVGNSLLMLRGFYEYETPAVLASYEAFFNELLLDINK
jgi:hypothetical protein